MGADLPGVPDDDRHPFGFALRALADEYGIQVRIPWTVADGKCAYHCVTHAAHYLRSLVPPPTPQRNAQNHFEMIRALRAVSRAVGGRADNYPRDGSQMDAMKTNLENIIKNFTTAATAATAATDATEPANKKQRTE